MENRGIVPSIETVESATSLPGAGVGAGIGLAVLSTDDALLDALERVVTADHALNLCSTEAELAVQVMASRCGVAVIDAAAASGPIEQLTLRLRGQFPDLVLIVAGTADHQGRLASQVTSGEVYRFLHKPISAQRVRLFVDAALRRHDEAHASAAPPAVVASAARRATTGKRRQPPVWVWAAAAITAAAIGWWALRPASETTTADAPATSPEAASETVPTPVTLPTLAPAPSDEAAARLATLLAEADRSLQAGQLDGTANALQQARALDPDNVQIAFLSAQLSRERERAVLTRARAAAASGDAGRALAVLENAADGPPSAQVTEARRSIEQQQVDERLRDLIRRGGDRLQRGAVLEPGSDNARFYFESARTIAPRDATVLRLGQQLSARTLTEARAAAARGDSAATDRWLRAASELGVASSDLTPIRVQLASVQANSRTEEVAQLSGLVAQRISQRRLSGSGDDTAVAYFTALRTLDPGSPQIQNLRQSLGSALIAELRAALGRDEIETGTRILGDLESAQLGAGELGAVRAELTAARERVRQSNTVIGVGALRRTRFVEPEFPREAREASIEGWVDLEFVVAPDGTVGDIRVTSAQPAGTFDRAATTALNRWRFEPVVRDGRPVEQRARLRMRFSLQ